MATIESSKFVKWEGDTYRVDRMSDGPILLFILKDGVFKPISSKLVATVEFEGVQIQSPQD